MEPLDDLPNTGVGLVPPSAAQVPGRLLAVEVRQQRLLIEMGAWRSLTKALVIAVVSASLGVMATVIGAAVYIGGRLQAVADLDRRVSRMEDRATLTDGGRR